jgi:hypothetical protein
MRDIKIPGHVIREKEKIEAFNNYRNLFNNVRILNEICNQT